ncbi:MAG: hypothetical protein H0U75_05435 [Legionella sp.]|nr:hypothetical protein [Legionella sp.]
MVYTVDLGSLSGFNLLGENKMVSAVKNSKVNSSLHKIDCISSMRSHQALQASALVGRQVFVNYDTLFLKQEGTVLIAIELSEGLTQVIASILAETGETLKTLQWEQTAQGLFQFTWDGTGQNNERLPSGQYKIKVYGLHGSKKVCLNTMIAANVDSVSLSENGKDMKLNIADMGSIPLDSLKMI